MAVANLNAEAVNVNTDNDSIVIREVLYTVIGGRTLDTTGFTPAVLNAGHVIIRETSSGNYKPMPVSGAAYAALPTGHTYEGVLIASILTAKPFAAILIGGYVNPLAMPYPIAPIQAAFTTAVPHILFKAD